MWGCSMVLTDKGVEYTQLNRDERSLKTKILYELYRSNFTLDFSMIVDNIRRNNEEYKNTKLTIFAKYTAELVKDKLVILHE
jgi:spore coat polysaccharide biosynthesis predicted glycosyltransferase SpsG